jgi:hypothetical protein
MLNFFRDGKNAQFLSRIRMDRPARLRPFDSPSTHGRARARRTKAGRHAHVPHAHVAPGAGPTRWAARALFKADVECQDMRERVALMSCQGSLPGSRDGRGRADGWQAPVEDDA